MGVQQVSQVSAGGLGPEEGYNPLGGERRAGAPWGRGWGESRAQRDLCMVVMWWVTRSIAGRTGTFLTYIFFHQTFQVYVYLSALEIVLICRIFIITLCFNFRKRKRTSSCLALMPDLSTSLTRTGQGGVILPYCHGGKPTPRWQIVQSGATPGNTLSLAFNEKCRDYLQACDSAAVASIPLPVETLGGRHDVEVDQIRKLAKAGARKIEKEEYDLGVLLIFR